ncbi:MAG: hypothetical protein JXR97_16180 [Planctomycetes bacterium]|nr:hypothetical protein [Planctomycetota bacterium]
MNTHLSSIIACILLIFTVTGSISAKDVDLGNFDNDKDGWAYYGGWEFAGASGSFEMENAVGVKDSGGGVLKGDFTNGGSYVAMTRNFWPPAPVENISFDAKGENINGFGIRVRDITGQTFQHKLEFVSDGNWKKVSLDSFECESFFGGAKDGKFHGYVTQISIMIGKPRGGVMKLTVDNIGGKEDKLSSSSTFSADLGEIQKDKGLYMRTGDNPKRPELVEKDKKSSGWKTSQQEKVIYFYGNIDDRISWTKAKGAEITVTYLDSGNGYFSLQYDSKESKAKEYGIINLADSGKWKKASFKIADPKFENNLNGDDFRIGVWSSDKKSFSPAEIVISKVEVKKK